MHLTLDDELEAIYENLVRLDPYYITEKQVGALASLITMGLTDKTREMRLSVLKLLAEKAMQHFEGDNFEVKSTKNVNGGIASFLIDQLMEPQSKPWRLSSFGKQLISKCEARVEKQTKV